MDEIKKVAIAMKMADEKKKFPSIRKLSKEAKCSEWNARKALNDLKKAN
jgi:DNA-binding transcriptional regulator YhcF (GntR family)